MPGLNGLWEKQKQRRCCLCWLPGYCHPKVFVHLVPVLTLSGNRVIIDVIKVRWSHTGSGRLWPNDCCLYKKDLWIHGIETFGVKHIVTLETKTEVRNSKARNTKDHWQPLEARQSKENWLFLKLFPWVGRSIIQNYLDCERIKFYCFKLLVCDHL